MAMAAIGVLVPATHADGHLSGADSVEAGVPAACRVWSNRGGQIRSPPMRGGIFVLNFYSAVFVDQLKRGRKTATIRLGDKSGKYERGQVVWVTVGFRHSPRERIFAAVIDDVEVKRVSELSPRDIEHDNPEFRRLEETVNFLEQIYGRSVSRDDLVTVIRFSQILEPAAHHLGNGETPSRN
jgi:hypothetical protein